MPHLWWPELRYTLSSCEFYFSVLGTEPMTSGMLGQQSTPELKPSPFYLFIEAGSGSVAWLSCDPPALASQVAGITGVRHRIWPGFLFKSSVLFGTS